MNHIDFRCLNDTEFFLKNIVSDFQIWKDNDTWITPQDGRVNTAIILVLSKCVVYKFHDGTSLTANPGDLVLLPHGSRYTCTFYETHSDAIELKFQSVSMSCLFLGFDLYDSDFRAVTFKGNPSVIYNCKNSDALRKFELLLRLSRDPLCTIGALCAEASGFLSYICAKYTVFSSEECKDDAFNKIAPYIHENASVVTTSDIIELSGMSASTFRRRFRERFGVTPVEYINSVKIQNARSYFESGITKVRDVSKLCGIEDEFYFSRLFTKIVGIPPCTYLKLIKNKNK